VTDTPLSDLMAEHADTQSPESYARFLALFRDSVVGIVAIGEVVEDSQGRSAAGDNLAAGRTTHGDGKPRLLAYADPEVAASRPDAQVNAGIAGRVLLQMAVGDPDCVGILVNSATGPISLVISDAEAEALVAGRH